ncbi:MAG: hypothetical protein IT204_24935 [Fimbriimonadaceae bacterium]|nr:hypothetical protein [Fimbriimonadaceae bacterium]
MRRLLAPALLLLVSGSLAAQTAVTSAELPLPNGLARWEAHEGWSITYRGQRVCLPLSSELVLHDPAWTTQYFNSSRSGDRGQLHSLPDGRRQLTVEYRSSGFQATQTVTAGPGDQLEVAWVWRQDGWDRASLQLGFPKPVESWWAGAPCELETSGRTTTGQVPLTYQKDRGQPFSGFERITARTWFGTAELRSTRPLAWYDYANRGGAFFVGWDLPVPRGQEQRATLTLRLAAPDLAAGGVRLSGLQVPELVVDRRWRGTLQLSREAAGPAQVTLTAEARQGDRPVGRVERVVTLDGQPQPAALELDLTATGRLSVVCTVATAAGVLLRSAPLAVTAEEALRVTPGRSFYTTETVGHLLASVRPEAPAAGLRLEAAAGALRLQRAVRPGERVALEFDAQQLPAGPAVPVTARLLAGDRLIGEQTTELRRLPPRANEVKIDYRHGGLIVDDLPQFPCGFYVQFPGDGIAAEEAPYGITHLAPYRGEASALTSDERIARMRAVLDRYATLGLRVHLDIKRLATAAQSPERDAAIRREVETLREHPALLAWYLADEPELWDYPPERIAAVYRLVRELDPYHPSSQVFARRDDAVRYASGFDLVMADPYPIPNSAVTQVSDTTRRLVEVFGGSKPVWIVPQAFGGGEWWAREPAPREERVMTYLALIHGATGIQWFIREPAHIRPLPLLLGECRVLATEIAELTPVLLSGLPRPTVRGSQEAAHLGAWRTPDATWVLAANTSNRPLDLAIDGLAGPATTAELPFEQRAVTVAGGRFSDLIDAFGTRVYRLPDQAEDRTAGLAPGNLTRNPSFEEQHVLGSPDGYYLGGDVDPGAQVRVDSRLAVHGRHSLRVVVPVAGQGYSLRPFPVALAEGKRYRVTLQARALRPGAKVRLALGGLETPAVTAEVGPAWQELRLEGRATKKDTRAQISYRVETAGTVWFDLLQLTELP